MLIIALTSVLLVSTSPSVGTKNWEVLEELFQLIHEPLSREPFRLEVTGKNLLDSALASGDCDRALVGHAIITRAHLLTNRSPMNDENELLLPEGCFDDYPRLNYHLGCRMQQAGKYDAAELRFLACSDSPKWASHAWNMIGTIRANRHDYEGAIEAWTSAQATAQGPPNPSIYINLGGVASNMGAWSEAAHWFNLALEAQILNEQEGTYSFLQNIRPIIHTNLLRSAINSKDLALADQTWDKMWPIEKSPEPLLDARAMLDYLLWKNQGNYIPGIVSLFTEDVHRDSIQAIQLLNDRVLLFPIWREATGWSLDRTIYILETAESSAAMRREVVNSNSSFSRDMIHATQMNQIDIAGALLLLLLFSGATWQWYLWMRLKRNRKALQLMTHDEFFEALSSWNEGPQGDGTLFQKELIVRLKNVTLQYRLSPAILGKLNPREVMIVQGILNGLSSQEIAENEGITTQRVYNLRSSIRAKLGLIPQQEWTDLIN